MTIDKFVSAIRQCQILSQDQTLRLEQIELDKQEDQSIEPFADLLVNSRVLTRFQADQLLTGSPESLRLGNYILLELIGEGGMGAVYRARHAKMNREVAVKVLAAPLHDSAEPAARFEREVEAAARLNHRNVVAALDADEVDGVPFLVMELIDGQDLGELVSTGGPLSVDSAIDTILQSAQGLEYLHSNKIVHRDVKPRNLMIDRSGTVKLLDVGLAHVEPRTDSETTAPQLTSTGQVLGTFDFMAPEQARNIRHADHRSDIYSLGCTLCYLLSGRPMYEGKSALEKINAHRKQPIPKLNTLCSEVPTSLEILFRSMVAKHPEDRPDSMQQVIAGLEEIRSHRESTAESDTQSIHHPASVERTDTSGRSRIVPWIGACTMAVLAAVAAIGWSQGWFTPAPKSVDRSVAQNDARSAEDEQFEQPNATSTPPAASVAEEASDDSNQTPPPADPPHPALTTTDPDRTAAEWVLGQGGSVEIAMGAEDQSQSILLPNQLPTDAFQLTQVNLSGTEVTDDQFIYLSRLQHLQTLNLYSCGQLTGNSLHHLKDLTSLTTLGLNGVPIQGSDLAYLAGNRQLSNLWLSQPAWQQEDLSQLPEFPALRQFGFAPGGGLSTDFDSLAKIEDLILHRGSVFSEDLFRQLALLPRLSRITLFGALNDSDLAQVSRLVNLRVIRWTDAELPASAATSLSQLSNLKDLTLRGGAVDDDDFDNLVGLGFLTRLRLFDTGLTPSTVARIHDSLPDCELFYHGQQLDQIHRATAEWVIENGGELRVGDHRSQSGLIRRAEDLPQTPFYVLTISVRAGSVTDNDMPRFRKLHTLLELHLFRNPALTDEGLVHLDQMWALRQLSLQYTGASGAGLGRLPSTLEVLDLRGIEFTSEQIDSLLRLKRLKWLHLDQIRPALISELANCSTLRSLNLDQASDQHLLEVTQLSDIENLGIWGGDFSSEGVQTLSSLTSLRKLTLRKRTPIDASWVPSFAALGSLEELVFSQAEISAEVLQQIRNALPNCKVVGQPTDDAS